MPGDGNRNRRRPTKTWRKTFNEDRTQMGITLNETKEIVKDRTRWTKLVAKVPKTTGVIHQVTIAMFLNDDLRKVN